MRGLLIHLVCRLLLRMSEAEVRAVADAYPLLAQVAIDDGPRRAGRRRIETAYAEARRLLEGGAREAARPEADYALEMLIASGAAKRFAGGDVTQETTVEEGLRRLARQRNLELTKNMLGLPLIAASQKKVFPEVEGAGGGVHQKRGDLLGYTEIGGDEGGDE